MFGGGLSILWKLLNAMQIISFLPLTDLHLPGFVFKFFAYLNFLTMKLLSDNPELRN
jgi:hypothetical protein